MPFPVDMLNSCSHEDLETSGEKYLFGLRYGDPNCPEFFSLPEHGNIPIRLSTVGFVPLYGEDLTHKVLALFAPQDSLTAVALYLAHRWWSIDDILRTSVHARQGLHQVNSVGERIVLYVLNRIVYRTQEMERNEVPFLCHTINAYAKIMWKKGEAIGFYSVKPTGSVCSSYHGQKYKLPVIDTMFVRKKHRGKDCGLMMLEDFVDSFSEDYLGLRYPLSPFVYTACEQYLEKYPGDQDLLWEVQGAGHWFQRRSIMSIWQMEQCKIADPNTTPVSTWMRGSHLKRPRIGKKSQEAPFETFQEDEENAVRVLESRLELSGYTPESSEDFVEAAEKTAVEEDKTVENEEQRVIEVEIHVSPPEKQSEKETLAEPLNGEVTEETAKTSLTDKEETASEVLSDESKLQCESQGEESLTLFVPLILESPAKPSEDTVSEKVLNANDSEMLTEESRLVEENNTEEQQESEKATTENAAALALKEEHSDNGLPNSTVTEAAEESVSENVSPKPASLLEDQNEEAGHNSQEAPVALSQSSLIVVELEGVSSQQPSGQEGQKNQLEEHSEESAEQMDQYMQTAVERAADSSSEEAEIEVPIVDRRSLRRKAKGYKGPPKKKGKPA
ncbi:PREDICTED: soluble lamin-associated protein of 75 kDa [Leptosomus discolor]|uniref:soluble lamin-associated protein of 75 kDa n=1 Tax=Leptosomus discolor TaxID=188344 RepID=UPI00052245CD|nr:PREDICTED: soluble lamin-associated protein of 75 kDa [Leptosomus discolor]